MEYKPFSLTPFQQLTAFENATNEYCFWGRGTGKSRYLGFKMQRQIMLLPGSTAAITAKTFTHVLTGILPAAFGHLEAAGFHRDIHYVIGKPPPKSWGLPFEPPIKDFERYITFYHPTRPVGFRLFSQDRSGTARGPNIDFEYADEFINIDFEQYYKEISATNRANKNYRPYNKYKWHNGQHFSSSMPYDKEAKKLLDKANYYIEDYGIDYISIWKQIVNAQLQLLAIDEKQFPEDFKLQLLEIARLKRKAPPTISRNGKSLFSFSNAFDNPHLGIDYIRDRMAQMPYIIFLIEIMNQIVDSVEDAFYNFNKSIHTFKDSFDYDFIDNYAQQINYNFKIDGSLDCRFDNKKYYNPNLPLYIAVDWGGKISFFLVFQVIEEFCQTAGTKIKTLYVHKEFFVKDTDQHINKLTKKFKEYYHYHNHKEVYYINDKWGDDRTGKINTSKTFNEETIDNIRKFGWKIHTLLHKGKEPLYVKKWEIMQNIFSETKLTHYPRIRINENNCPFLIISLENTQYKIDLKGKLYKNKSSEKNPSFAAEESTHASDALDKACYTLHNRTQPTHNKQNNNIIRFSSHRN